MHLRFFVQKLDTQSRIRICLSLYLPRQHLIPQQPQRILLH